MRKTTSSRTPSNAVVDVKLLGDFENVVGAIVVINEPQVQFAVFLRVEVCALIAEKSSGIQSRLPEMSACNSRSLPVSAPLVSLYFGLKFAMSFVEK